MKHFFTILIAFTLLISSKTYSQDLSNPGAYMTAVSSAQLEMNKKYMAYMSASAHSSRKRKVEKLRLQVVESIDNSRYKTIDLPLYKSDNTLRQSSIDYIKLISNIFNEDYSKIVNMEEIAEQSFDEMQAYMLLQEKTDQKLAEAATKMSDATKAFATKYNVTLIEGNDELGKKLGETGKLNSYRNSIYLIFFKCNWQDGEIIKALNTGKLTQVEQGRTSLIRYADEGLAALASLKSFEGDGSLANACKTALNFYKKMAETDLPKQTDFLLKQEDFEKLKKAFEKKSEPTKDDVKLFNTSVNDINKASALYNTTINKINTDRNNALNNWNQAQVEFADQHMPHYKN